MNEESLLKQARKEFTVFGLLYFRQVSHEESMSSVISVASGKFSQQ
jgi:hypothetical protein